MTEDPRGELKRSYDELIGVFKEHGVTISIGSYVSPSDLRKVMKIVRPDLIKQRIYEDYKVPRAKAQEVSTEKLSWDDYLQERIPDTQPTWIKNPFSLEIRFEKGQFKGLCIEFIFENGSYVLNKHSSIVAYTDGDA